MDQELKDRLAKQDKMLQEIYVSVEKTRKYFLWTIIATVVVVVLPAILLMFALPSFIANLTGLTAGL